MHRFTEHILSHRRYGRPTGSLFFDVAKAFDRVWHAGLIFKLANMGLPDSLVRILKNFLSNRTFRYRLEGCLSSPHPIRAGVPQGSVLA
ncbi:reverse transcriptase domain-containing protein, partial [Proteus faecis]|uniref:reverse transcriptase domain-containing protein n=1 Tax=Proteus faecis TaxID=2050967 RepID=UPI003B02B20A